jgi:hypothetical protein
MVFGIYMYSLSPLCFSTVICLTLLDSITLIKLKYCYFYPSFTDGRGSLTSEPYCVN